MSNAWFLAQLVILLKLKNAKPAQKTV